MRPCTLGPHCTCRVGMMCAYRIIITSWRVTSKNGVCATRSSWFRLQIKLNVVRASERTCVCVCASVADGIKCVNSEATHSHSIYSEFGSFIHWIHPFFQVDAVTYFDDASTVSAVPAKLGQCGYNCCRVHYLYDTLYSACVCVERNSMRSPSNYSRIG